MAATSRGTPSYNVPSTQNTAPVLEFRCLYTHDLFKKQKKWHDGSLKFHTFNRRVMVYDDVKNYIGDLHYRQDEEFGEGLELQLDRPVKVEVGEPIGKTETDLAPLFDKGRGEREPRSATELPRPIHRLHASSSTGRPKSLLDVLGTSQGRLGRARLPLQSPFEQRQNLSEPLLQPPAKRQRTASGKENNLSLPTQSKTESEAGNGQKTTTKGKVAITPRVTAAPMRPPPAHSIVSPYKDGSTGQRQSLKPRTKPALVNAEGVSISPRRPGSPSVPRIVRTAALSDHQKVRSPRAQSDTPVQNGDLPQVHPVLVVAEAQPPQHKSPPALAFSNRPLMTKLRMRSHTPRKKLMYKALLPHATGISTTNIPRVSNTKSPCSVGLMAEDAHSHFSDEDACFAPAMNEPDIEEQTDIQTSGQRSNQLIVKDRSHATILISSSPMFVSQDASQLSYPPHDSHMLDDMDFILSQNDNAARLEAIHGDEVEKEPKSDEIQHIPQSPAAPQILEDRNDDHSCHSSSVEVPSERYEERVPEERIGDGSSDIPIEEDPLSNGSQRLQLDTTDDIHPNPANSDMDNHPMPLNSQRTPLRRKEVVSSPVQVVESPMKQLLQRAQSDSVALEQMRMATPITVRPSQLVQPKQDDQGPWTKLEAFLLFEKWPATKAKDKPTFTPRQQHQAMGTDADVDEEFDDYDGINEDIDLSMDRSTRSKVSSCRGAVPMLPGIRSARSVLRDEI